MEILQKKFERKAQLKEEELDLRQMELELQPRKLDQEEAAHKQEQEERRNDWTHSFSKYKQVTTYNLLLGCRGYVSQCLYVYMH